MHGNYQLLKFPDIFQDQTGNDRSAIIYLALKLTLEKALLSARNAKLIMLLSREDLDSEENQMRLNQTL